MIEVFPLLSEGMPITKNSSVKQHAKDQRASIDPEKPTPNITKDPEHKVRNDLID